MMPQSAHNEKKKIFGIMVQTAEAISFQTSHNVENNVETVSLIKRGVQARGENHSVFSEDPQIFCEL